MSEFVTPESVSLTEMHTKSIMLMSIGETTAGKLMMSAMDEIARLRLIAGVLLEDQGRRYSAMKAIVPGSRWKLQGGEVVEVLRVEVQQGALTVTLKYPTRGEEVDVSAKYLLTWCNPAQ